LRWKVWFVEHGHICTMLILYPFNQLFPLQDCVTKQTIYQLTHKLSPLTFLPKFFTFQNLMCKRSIRYFILSIYIPSSSQLHSLFHVSTVVSKYLYQYSIPTSFQHFLLWSFYHMALHRWEEYYKWSKLNKGSHNRKTKLFYIHIHHSLCHHIQSMLRFHTCLS